MGATATRNSIGMLPSADVEDAHELLRNDMVFQGLTPQQEMFCKLMFQGVTKGDAYRQAYNCQLATPDTVAHMASTASKHPKIVARLDQLQKRWEKRASLDALISRDEITRGIAAIAFDPTVKHADRLKAYKMLGEMVGVDLWHRPKDGGPKPKRLDDLSLAEIEDKLAARVAELRTVGSSST